MSAVEAVEHLRDAVEPVDADRLQIGAEHGFHRAFPAALDPQLLREPRALIERLGFQPLRDLAGCLAERRLLQGLGRDLHAHRGLPPGAQLVHGFRLLALAFARRRQFREQFLQFPLRLLPRRLDLRGLLAERLQRHRGTELAQLDALGLLALPLLQKLALLAFELFDARALHLRLALAERRGFGMAVPGLLPLGQSGLRLLERLARRLLVRVRAVETRNQGREFGRQRFDLRAVARHRVGEFARLCADDLQIRPLPLPQFARVLDVLLDPRHVGARFVIARLDRGERFRARRLVGADAFDFRLRRAQVRDHRVHRGLALPGRFAADRGFRIQALQAQRQQFRLQLALFLLQDLIASRGRRLALQVPDLLLDFLAQVVEAIEVLARMPDPVLGLAAPFLVAGDAGGLFEERAQIVRTRLDHA